MKKTERAYEYWFASIRGLSDEKKIRLRSQVDSAKKIYYIEEVGS